MLVGNGSNFSAKDIIVNGAPTALRVEDGGHCIILDSSFQGTNGAAAAIDLGDGHLFARNIQKAMNSGKPAILFTRNFYLVNGTVTIPKTVRQVSFLYGCVIRTQFREEAPFRVMEPSSEPLLLQQSMYNMGGVFLDHAADRTVVLEDMASMFPHGGRSAVMMNAFLNPVKPAQYDDTNNCWRLYRNATPAGKPKKLFVNNALGFAPGGPDNRFAVENVTIWCRQANTEHFAGNNFAFRRSTAWMLGFKTEGGEDCHSFSALDGTRLEVLNGFSFQINPQTVSYILAGESAVCVVMNVACETSRAPILEDVKNGKANVISLAACSPLNVSRTRRDLNDVSATNWHNEPTPKEVPVIPLLVNYGAQNP